MIPTALLLVLTLLPAETSWPLGDRLIWLPMTGVTEAQLADAAGAGYGAVLWKIRPQPLPARDALQFEPIDDKVAQARRHGLESILAIIGEGALNKDAFFDVDEQGNRLPGQLDPFDPDAMARIEWAYAQVIDRYRTEPDVVAFIPTWGIYGEAGFTSFAAGRSGHALARFNEWLRQRGLPVVETLPTRAGGPGTAYNRFIRFRYLYMEEQFDGIISRLKNRAGGKAVGTWQELYPAIGYLWTMVEVPSADFALYEACFPFQTSHHPEKTLAETMGFRYRCDSAEDYHDYYLPLIARKRGEGQRFMGCQLSNHYAVSHYGWPEEKVDRIQFDRWEDRFAPRLNELNNLNVEQVAPDVLLVFPTYAAAALSDSPVHSVDVMTMDVLLRMFGCRFSRCGSPALDKMTVEQLNRYRLIIVPCAALLTEDTLAKLERAAATVVFTGGFGQSLDGEYTPFGQERRIHGMHLRYAQRPEGNLVVSTDHRLTRDLTGTSAMLPQDESFTYVDSAEGMQVYLQSADQPVLSSRDNDRLIFIHGHLFAGLAYDPERKPPPNLSGSADPSANEVDLWGPYSSAKRENSVGQMLMRNILDLAGVDYRVPEPRPRTRARYLGDHMEQASVSANIAYNNTEVPQRLKVRLPYRPQGWTAKRVNDRFEARVTIPPFSYILLGPAAPHP